MRARRSSRPALPYVARFRALKRLTFSLAITPKEFIGATGEIIWPGGRIAYWDNLFELPQIPRLHLDRIEMQIGIDDIPRPRPFRKPTRIRHRRPMMKLIAASMRQRKGHVALINTCKFRRQVDQPVGDEMHDVAFPLNAAIALSPVRDRCPRSQQVEMTPLSTYAVVLRHWLPTVS